MMLELGNSEKRSHCIQTHTPFTVGSQYLENDCERQGIPGPFREHKERIDDRCSTRAINKDNL